MRNFAMSSALSRLTARFGDGLAGPLITGKATPESHSTAPGGAAMGVGHPGKVNPAGCNGMEYP